MKIAVLMGGPSAEREVSMASGRMVAQALLPTDMEVIRLGFRFNDQLGRAQASGRGV